MKPSLPGTLALGVILLFCLPLVGCGDSKPTASASQVQAIETLRKQGGIIQDQDGVAMRVTLTGEKVTDDVLPHLKELRALQYLNLSGATVTDAGLAHLSELTDLLFLDLSGTRVSDAGLMHLKGMSKLQYVWLQDTQVSDAGASGLKASLRQCAIEK